MQMEGGNIIALVEGDEKLESLSREDLIRFVKKQVAKLKQAQKETSDLKGEVQVLSQELKNVQESRDLERERTGNEINELKSRLDDAVAQVQEAERDFLEKCQAHCRLQTECLTLRQALANRTDNAVGQLGVHGDGHELGAHDGGVGEKDGGALARDKDSPEIHAFTQTEGCIVENSDIECQTDAPPPPITAEKSLSREEVATRDAEINRLKRELTESNSKITRLQETMAERAALSLEAADWEKDAARAKSDLQNALQRATQAERCTEELRVELDNAHEQQKMVEQQRIELIAATQKLDSELADAKSETTATREQLDQCQLKLQNSLDQIESLKLQLSDTGAASDQTKSRLLSAERAAKQHKEASLKAGEALDSLRVEFDQYKSRVTAVLRERQQKESCENVAWKEEIERIRSEMTSLQSQLDDANDLNNRLNNELSVARTEGQSLSSEIAKMKRMLDDERISADKKLGVERRSLEQRLDAMVETKNNEITAIQHRATELEASLHREITERAAAESEHRSKEEDLREQLRDLKTQLDSVLQQQTSANPQSTGHAPARHPANQQPTHTLVHRESTNSLGTCSLEMNNEHWQSGEGTPTPRAVHVHARRTPPTLDQLLRDQPAQSTRISTSPPDREQNHYHSAVTSPAFGNKTSDRANSDILAANATLAHVSALLKDSEETAERHAEQIEVLKAEIRRLNRNEERQAHMAHCEYVKNVVVKFITSEQSEQRARLVPVLSTLLGLSNDELGQIKRIAHAEGDQNNGPSASGWTAYLHRWSATS